MGTEQPADFYDSAYRENEKYRVPAPENPWAQMHLWALSYIGREMVIDLGCGVGYLAHLLEQRGHSPGQYLGIDFSGEAISQARARVPGFRFVRGDILAETRRIAGIFEGATIVACEVLEHITHDLPVLRAMPVGTRVIATVPSHDSAGHVRHFETMAVVAKRYEHALRLQSIERLGRCYGFVGVRVAPKG